MATYREIVYMVLDLLKERSDDAYYTEEHIIFLASRIRDTLLEKTYGTARFTSISSVSNENMQTVCLNLIPATTLNGCGSKWLRSIETVPNLLSGMPAKVHTVNDLVQSMITYVPKERMPYVGYNKWLKSIVYCSRSSDGHLYFHSTNSQFMYLEKAIFSGVFSKPEEAALLECNETGEVTKCDLLDKRFPLEGGLVASCIEMTTQELLGSRYAPEDKHNNAKDDFSEAATTPQTATKPVTKDDE